MIDGAAYWQHACAAWPTAGTAADYGPAGVTDTPVLIMNGSADPQDPPGNMADATQRWPHSRQLSEPHQSHNIAAWSCQESIIESFIEQGSPDDLDTGCLGTVPLPTIPLGSG